jgi:hypothetical protein
MTMEYSAEEVTSAMVFFSGAHWPLSIRPVS